MERIRELTTYQKGVLLFLAAMVVVFTVLYPLTVRRVGFDYQGTILTPSRDGEKTVYSGKIKGQQAVFTVSDDKTVRFQYGQAHYGPYTVKEDPSAVPKEEELAEFMTGVEVRKGKELLFRGGVLDQGYFRLLYNEDGSAASIQVIVTMSDGTQTDGDGNVIDPMEPDVATILDLAAGPKLTHKGDWTAWLFAVAVCVSTVISILFAEELFWLKMSFRVQNPNQAEPSDWEIGGRYITWTVLPVLALVLFLMGLQ